MLNYLYGSNVISSIYLALAYIHGEGNGTPLQCSCLEDPWASVYGVAQSQTRLK